MAVDHREYRSRNRAVYGRLTELSNHLTTYPTAFTFIPKVKNCWNSALKWAQVNAPLDYGMAEASPSPAW